MTISKSLSRLFIISPISILIRIDDVEAVKLVVVSINIYGLMTTHQLEGEDVRGGASSHKGHQIDDLELPQNTKHLLIASYLASYNPSSTDSKYFSKVWISILTSNRSLNSISVAIASESQTKSQKDASKRPQKSAQNWPEKLSPRALDGNFL